jgi:methylated-DNA-[protein]-cysteine S-methyltransferase
MSTTSPTRPSAPAVALDVAVLDSPVGPLVVMARDGVVVTSGFGTVEHVTALLPPHLRGADLREGADLGPIADAVAAYTGGELDALDTVPVEQPGGPFLSEVWRVMREIPPGSTWSYTELATKAGRPAAVRAAGQGCALNRVAPFVPCHRVLRSDGTLGGYAYGLPTKRALLAFEAGTNADAAAGQLF